MTMGTDAAEKLLALGARRHVPPSMAEFAYQSLRGAILNGSLSGGSRLVIANTARSLGVSSTPLRDALRELSHEGLVELDARKGAQVRTIGVDEAQKSWRSREVIEALLTAEATGLMNDADVEQLRELAAGMADAERARDYSTWMQLNVQFHSRIADAAQWDDLSDVYRSLHAKGTLHVGNAIGFAGTHHGAEFWTAESDRANREHEAILAAIGARDAEEAARLMAVHLRATYQHIAAAMAQTGTAR